MDGKLLKELAAHTRLEPVISLPGIWYWFGAISIPGNR